MNKIKISIRVLAIMIALLLCMQAKTFAATGKSTAVNVRVRETASTNAEVIELLALDDVVEILGKEGDWYKISYNKKIGYVSQSFIKTNETIEDTNVQTNNQENNANNDNNNENNNINNNSNNNEENSENKESEAEKTEENNEQNAAEPSNEENQTSNTEEQQPVNKIYKMSIDSNLNILPVVTSELIGNVKKDTEVSLISNAGLWAYIKVDNNYGWVRYDKLSVEEVLVVNTPVENVVATEQPKDNEAQKEENKEQQSNYTPKTMYSKVSALNIRSQANTTSDVIDSISLNTQVKVVGEENGWYKVEVNGKSGYIRNDLLSNEKTEVSSRSNDVERKATQKDVEVSVETTLNSNNTQTSVANTETKTTTTSSSGVTGEDIVAYAMQFKGCRYVYGAAGPKTFDCSGLTMYVYKHFGYNLSHSSKVQATQGKAVTGELQPGDILVFSNNGKTVGHVGLYIGNDQFIHASDSNTGVIISRLSDKCNKSKYWGARRIL